MTTYISRDSIQFEKLSAELEIDDGNGQAYHAAAATAWKNAATDYLEDHGGGEASLRHARDLSRFDVTGDKTTAEAADEAGWRAAREKVRELYTEAK